MHICMRDCVFSRVNLYACCTFHDELLPDQAISSRFGSQARCTWCPVDRHMAPILLYLSCKQSLTILSNRISTNASQPMLLDVLDASNCAGCSSKGGGCWPGPHVAPAVASKGDVPWCMRWQTRLVRHCRSAGRRVQLRGGAAAGSRQERGGVSFQAVALARGGHAGHVAERLGRGVLPCPVCLGC